MKEWYQQTKEEILSQFQVTEQGLTSSQAEKILAEKGENVLEEGKRKSTLRVFLGAVLRPAGGYPDYCSPYFHGVRQCGEHGSHPGCYYPQRHPGHGTACKG